MSRKADTYLFRDQWMTLGEISELVGVSYNTVWRRVDGWVVRDSFKQRRPKGVLWTFQGKSQSISAWAKELAINESTLRDRVGQSGWSIERALSEPITTPADQTRRRRNLKAIKRVCVAFRTGGQSKTFQNSPGTGGGRHARHLQSEERP